MTDFEIHSPDDATMQSAAQAIGLSLWHTGNAALNIAPGINTGGFSTQGVLWAINYYGQKSLPSGTIAAGVYAILRWCGDPSLIPQPPAGSGVTIGPIPADSPFVFA